MECIPKLHRDTVVDSVRHLAGKPFTQAVLEDTCWRLAGNVPRLRERKAVTPWHVQRMPEWVPAQVVSCKTARGSKDRVGGYFGFRILGGTPCPSIAFKWWSFKFCRFVATDFGFSKPSRSRILSAPYVAPEQFVSLRLNLLIDPELCGEEPGFHQIEFSSEHRAWNSKVIKCRFRTDPDFECKMEETPDDLPCHKCPLGFKSCFAGAHREDWVEQHCAGCDQKTWFDPETSKDRCIDCAVQAVYSNKPEG